MKLQTKKLGFEHYTLTFYWGSDSEITFAELEAWSTQQLETNLALYCHKHQLNKSEVLNQFRKLRK